MIDAKVLENAIDNYDDPRAEAERIQQRHVRLKTLVEKYGVEAVAKAGGLTESSVNQYISTSRRAVSDSALIRMEAIFNKV